jgi:hypothetical protein
MKYRSQGSLLIKTTEISHFCSEVVIDIGLLAWYYYFISEVIIYLSGFLVLS